MLTGFSDDQIALIGCVSALFVCGGLMSLSYYLRPREMRDQDTSAANPATLAFPRSEVESNATERRAA